MNQSNLDLNQKENQKSNYIILLIHGFQTFQRPGRHDFDFFIKYATNKINVPIEKVYWYDSSNKETIGTKKFKKTINAFLNKYNDKEIILVGYSMGSVIALSFAANRPNVKKIIAIYPTIFINFKNWIKILTKTRKWNNEQFKLLKKTNNNEPKIKLEETPFAKFFDDDVFLEKNLTKLTVAVYQARKKFRKKIKKLENKNISIIFNSNDQINDSNKSLEFINKYLIKNNKIDFIETKGEHGSALKENEIEMFDLLINSISNYLN